LAYAPEAIAAELAPTGVLRAAINTGNMLLVTGRDDAGDPAGVAPDLAREVAARLALPIRFTPFARPADLADAAADGVWDIGLIGAEPARARKIAFSEAYAEIEACYLVPAGSPLMAVADVDRPGVRIAVAAGSAYDLWLDRNLKHASLVRSKSTAEAEAVFAAQGLEVLAALREGLQASQGRLDGARILPGRFMAVQQAVGTQKQKPAAAAFLGSFIEEAKASGLIARLIDRHGMTGRLTVAPPAPRRA
jgi:polar amino acid transport system substrate-binding protein